MAEKVTIEKWKSEDGRTYDTQIEALVADVNFWKNKYQKELQRITPTRSRDDDRYTSGPGGGRSNNHP